MLQPTEIDATHQTWLEHSPGPAGVPLRIKHIKGLATPDAYNAAIVECRADPVGGWFYLAYRAVQEGGNSIGWATLNSELNVVLGMPGTTANRLPLYNNLDPRLTWWNDRLLMSTSYGPTRTSRMELRHLAITGGGTAKEVDQLGVFNSIDNWPGYTTRVEKNWIPFESHYSPHLRFLYSINPLRVLHYNEEAQRVELYTTQHFELPEWWKDEWGRELRCSAPPTRFANNTFLGTWHTRSGGQRGGNYYTGFFTFSYGGSIRSITPPVVLPEHATGQNVRQRHAQGCVFIQGMVILNGTIILSGGDNDHSCVVAVMPLQDVLRALEDVKAGPTYFGDSKLNAR